MCLNGYDLLPTAIKHTKQIKQLLKGNKAKTRH